ncbi:lipoprotein LpqH [Mycolicibacterium komossense]|nr:lipoprotein LpqH [Mycolicibacterium komossense]
MKRVLAAVIGLSTGATILMACSENQSHTSASSSPAASSATASTAASSNEVKVDGADLAGLDLNTVTCVKSAGKITVASGAVGGQQGIGIVMTDAATPTVESLGMVVDGNSLAVSDSMGMKVGSAVVSVDGNSYTITGEATGADMKNPMAGMINKKFTVKVTCN